MNYESKIGRPWRGYYITAYGIAVKHGFVGSEAQWLETLKGAKIELRYDTQTEQLEYKYADKDSWIPIMSIAQLQGELVTQTIAQAEAAQRAAKQSESNANYAASVANDAAAVAAQKAEEAEAAFAGADSAMQEALRAKLQSGIACAGAEMAMNNAQTAQKASETVRDDAVAAKELAEAAQRAAEQSKSNANYAASVANDAAAVAAQKAKEAAEAAKEADHGYVDAQINRLQSQIDDILYEPIAGTVTITPSIAENGCGPFGGMDAVIRWSFSKAPIALKIDGIEREPTIIGEIGTIRYTADKISVWAIDERGAIFSRTLIVSFTDRIYYGGITGNTTAEKVKAMASDLKTSVAGSYSITLADGDVICFATTAVAVPRFIIGGFDYELTQETVEIANAYGITKTYYVYRTGQPLTAGMRTLVVS